MQRATNIVLTLVQLIIGLLILLGKADIRTLAWFYVGAGIATVTLLIFIGAVRVIQEKK